MKHDFLVEAQRNGRRQENTGESERKEKEKWDAAYLLQTLFSEVPIKKKAKIFWGQPLLEMQQLNATIKYLLLLIKADGAKSMSPLV